LQAVIQQYDQLASLPPFDDVVAYTPAILLLNDLVVGRTKQHIAAFIPQEMQNIVLERPNGADRRGDLMILGPGSRQDYYTNQLLPRLKAVVDQFKNP